jgi:hypothetical protein
MDLGIRFSTHELPARHWKYEDNSDVTLAMDEFAFCWKQQGHKYRFLQKLLHAET